MEYYDCVIVGLGAIGIGTLRYLSNSKLSVLGIDQGSIINKNSTSYGQSRLIRLAYGNENYVPILRDSLNDWKNLEETSNNKLLYDTGTYKIGHNSGTRLDESINTCENKDIKYNNINISNLPDIFNINEKNYNTIYQPQSGILDAQTCLKTQLNIARKNNAKIKSNTKLKNYIIKDNKIHIFTDSKNIKSDKLIITTGCWAYNQFEFLKDKINLKLHTYTHFIDKNSTKEKFGFTIETEKNNPDIYGLVEPKSSALKLGIYGKTDKKLDIKPNNFERGYNSEISDPESENGVDLFDISTNSYIRDSCIISESIDENPIIDYVNKDPDIIIGVGMSGHGFKYSNSIGKIISSMITNEHNFAYNLPNFKLNRF